MVIPGRNRLFRLVVNTYETDQSFQKNQIGVSRDDPEKHLIFTDWQTFSVSRRMMIFLPNANNRGHLQKEWEGDNSRFS